MQHGWPCTRLWIGRLQVRPLPLLLLPCVERTHHCTAPRLARRLRLPSFHWADCTHGAPHGRSTSRIWRWGSSDTSHGHRGQQLVIATTSAGGGHYKHRRLATWQRPCGPARLRAGAPRKRRRDRDDLEQHHPRRYPLKRCPACGDAPPMGQAPPSVALSRLRPGVGMDDDQQVVDAVERAGRRQVTKRVRRAGLS